MFAFDKIILFCDAKKLMGLKTNLDKNENYIFGTSNSLYL